MNFGHNSAVNYARVAAAVHSLFAIAASMFIFMNYGPCFFSTGYKNTIGTTL